MQAVTNVLTVKRVNYQLVTDRPSESGRGRSLTCSGWDEDGNAAGMPYIRR